MALSIIRLFRPVEALVEHRLQRPLYHQQNSALPTMAAVLSAEEESVSFRKFPSSFRRLQESE